MTFSTELLYRELAAVRGYDGGECVEFTPAQLHDVGVALGNARRSLDALVINVAGEFGRRSAPDLGVKGLSRTEGFNTPQEMLAKVLGTSTYDAKRLLDVGKALADELEGEAGGDVSADGIGATDVGLEPGGRLGSEGAPGREPLPSGGGSGDESLFGGVDGGDADGSGADSGGQEGFALEGAGARPGFGGVPGAARAVPRAKFPYLTRTVETGAIGVEAAALVTRTLNALEPVLLSNARVRVHEAHDGAADGAVDTAEGTADHTPGNGDDAQHATSQGGAVDPRSGASDIGGDRLEDEARRLANGDLREYERRLVDKAQELSLREFRRACDRERAWLSPKDLVERERRQRDERTLFFGEDAEGMTTITAKLDAASAAPVKAWVEAQVRFAFQQRRKAPKEDGNDVVDEGLDDDPTGLMNHLTPAERCAARAAAMNDERTPGQIRVDALAALALHGLDCGKPTSGVKTTVVLRMDVKDLDDDLAQGECDQIRGPISVGTLRMMAADAQVIPMVMGGDSLPLDVGKHDRFFTRAQRIALGERDGGCSWCHAPPSFCQAHHIDWWAKHDGRTDLGNGVLLCVSCHHRIHRDGWGIQVRGGQVWFQPPPIDGRTQPERIGGKAHLALAA